MYRKIVVSGQVVEVWEYEKLNVTGGGKREVKDLLQKEDNYATTQRRRRAAVRQLALSNFDSHSKFVTLTFDNNRDFDISSVASCNAVFKQFLRRLKRRYPQLRYLAVIEFQDATGRGAVHYHMLCNLPYIKNEELRELWGCGFVKINAIDKVDNIGAYISKYMAADLDDKRLQGLKAYQYSRTLKKPVEVASWRPGESHVMHQISENMRNKTPVYERTYTSEEAGAITYLQYNLTRKGG